MALCLIGFACDVETDADQTTSRNDTESQPDDSGDSEDDPVDKPKPGEVTEETFNGTWPFTVDSGLIDCVQEFAVIFTTGGKTYAVNGFASGLDTWADIDPIWAKGKGGIPKKNIGDIIDQGLDLC